MYLFCLCSFFVFLQTRTPVNPFQALLSSIMIPNPTKWLGRSWMSMKLIFKIRKIF
ncbi:hypothetical protein HanRHA438_Chr02g0051061 [Helianthus annuus]|nr:hypothetical protein HanRHA438_Chr02g0051061 [Helianthus annuus]